MIALKINGETREVDLPEDMPLLWVLCDILGLTGTKYGCGIAQCGACTVHLDGQPLRSCVLPIGTIGTQTITTIGEDRRIVWDTEIAGFGVRLTRSGATAFIDYRDLTRAKRRFTIGEVAAKVAAKYPSKRTSAESRRFRRDASGPQEIGGGLVAQTKQRPRRSLQAAP